ncbi:MAG: hypothetical protein IJ226_00325, partial [Clostridia bacterium]|nr:hypothetical protein [Clostridia bacterium]
LASRCEDRIEVDSAGTMRHEKPMTPLAKSVLDRHNVAREEYISKFVDKPLYDGADYIFVMTEAHKIMLSALYGKSEKVMLMSDFLGHEVADPYGLGEAAYEAAYQDLETAIPQIADFLQKQL